MSRRLLLALALAAALPCSATGPKQTTQAAPAASGVTSFNSRTGAVVPASGDYSSFYAPLASPTLTGTTTTPTLAVSGSVSASAPGTAGFGLKGVASTYTDTGAGGAVTELSAHGLAAPTLTSSNAETATSASLLHLTVPSCTGSLTCTTLYSLIADGRAWFKGTLTTQNIVNTGSVTQTGGVVSLNASSNSAVNIGTGTTTSTVTLGGGANVVAVGSHLSFTGSAASISGTGCSAGTPAPNDARGTITASAATSCVVTFQTAYATTPVCVASTGSGSIAVGVAPGTGSVTFSTAALTGSIYYHCEQ